IGWLSFSDIRLPEVDFERAAKEFDVAEPMTKHAFELADGIQVLRSAGIATYRRCEVRHRRRHDIGQFAGALESDLGRDLEPNDARHRSVDSSPGGDPRVPGVPLESLLAETEERCALAGSQGREDRMPVRGQVRARLTLDQADDRAIAEVGMRPVLDDEVGAATFEDIGRESRFRGPHHVLQTDDRVEGVCARDADEVVDEIVVSDLHLEVRMRETTADDKVAPDDHVSDRRRSRRPRATDRPGSRKCGRNLRTLLGEEPHVDATDAVDERTARELADGRGCDRLPRAILDRELDRLWTLLCEEVDTRGPVFGIPRIYAEKRQVATTPLRVSATRRPRPQPAYFCPSDPILAREGLGAKSSWPVDSLTGPRLSETRSGPLYPETTCGRTLGGRTRRGCPLRCGRRVLLWGGDCQDAADVLERRRGRPCLSRDPRG